MYKQKIINKKQCPVSVREIFFLSFTFHRQHLFPERWIVTEAADTSRINIVRRMHFKSHVSLRSVLVDLLSDNIGLRKNVLAQPSRSRPVSQPAALHGPPHFKLDFASGSSTDLEELLLAKAFLKALSV